MCRLSYRISFMKASCLSVLLFILTIFSASSVSAQLAQNKCKFLGNIISNSTPSDFLGYWNQVTPENAGKWGSVESVRNEMNWTPLDNAYNFAKENSIPFKQHAFVWGSQQPAWIESLPADEQLAEIVEWISTYCDRYPDTDYIDVVNEPLHAAPSGAGKGNYIAALGGSGSTGWDWVIKSFEITREHCPNAKLILNEYGIINDNSATQKLKTIINLLDTRGLIDGIGVQGHRFELENASNQTLTSNLTALGNTDLPVYISEFDLGNIGDTGTPDNTEQLELYKRIFPLLWTHPAVHGITLWGYRQGETWMKTVHLKNSNGTDRPAFTWLKSYVPTAPGGVFCLTPTEPNVESLDIYPNPVDNGRFTVSLPGPASRLMLFDAQGREVYSVATENSLTFEAEVSQESGLYLLVIQGENKTFRKRIVVRN